MKAFRKWWKKYSWEGIWDYEDLYRVGWQEALEMVRVLIDKHWDKNYASAKDALGHLDKDIREELEEK